MGVLSRVKLVKLNYISQNSLSYVSSYNRPKRDFFFLQDLEDINKMAAILQSTTSPCLYEAKAGPETAPVVPGSSFYFSDSWGKCVCFQLHNEVFWLLQDTALVKGNKNQIWNVSSWVHLMLMGSLLFLFLPTLHPSSLRDSTWPVDLRFHLKCEAYSLTEIV